MKNWANKCLKKRKKIFKRIESFSTNFPFIKDSSVRNYSELGVSDASSQINFEHDFEGINNDSLVIKPRNENSIDINWSYNIGDDFVKNYDDALWKIIRFKKTDDNENWINDYTFDYPVNITGTGVGLNLVYKRISEDGIKVINVYPTRIKTVKEFTYGLEPRYVAEQIYDEHINDVNDNELIIDGRPEEYR